MFAQTLVDEHCTAIYYFTEPGQFSALHRLDSTEVFHHYAGAPARMLLLHPDGTVTEPVLGSDFAAGERPQVIVLDLMLPGVSGVDLIKILRRRTDAGLVKLL